MFPVEASFSGWQGTDGRQYGAILRDISVRKREAEKTRYLAEHDSLTGLANRYTLDARVAAMIATADAAGAEVALLVVGLDGFQHINDLLGQQVQMTFLDLPVLLPQIKAGALRPIAVGSADRAPTAPDVPTTAELGLPELRIENWYGMVAPKGTPDTVIATLNRITREAMADPAVKDKLASQGATLIGDTPEHFRGFIDTEIKKWADVIKDAGIETAK